MAEKIPQHLIDLHTMTRRQFAMGALSIAAGAKILSPNDAFGQAAKTALEVSVLDAITGAPVSGAEVRLTSGDGQSSDESRKIMSRYPDNMQPMLGDLTGKRTPPSTLSLLTDRNGRVQFRDIATGPYKLNASAENYVMEFYGSSQWDLVGDLLHLSAEQKVQLRLTPAGSVSGTIRDEQGTPVGGLQVYLLYRTFTADGNWRFSARADTTTDAQGRYSIDGVRVGRFYLVAGSELRLINSTASDEDKKRERLPYSWTYYPGVADPLGATSLDLVPQGRLGGIDLTVKSAPRYRVRGRFRMPGAPNSARAFETALAGPAPQFDGIRMQERAPSTRKSFRTDTFELDGLVDGTYSIGVTPYIGRNRESNLPADAQRVSGRSGTQIYDAFVTFTVAGKDVEDLELLVGTPSLIQGIVRTEGGAPVPLAPGRKLGLLFETKSLVKPAAVGFMEVGETGRFQAYNLSGEYSLRVDGLAADAYVKQIRLNGTPVPHGAMNISAGSEIEITIAPNGCTLTGVALDEKSNPVQAVALGALLAEPALPAPFHKTFYTDPKGAFRLQGIPPGTYRLFLWSDLDERMCFDPSIMERSRFRASTMQLRSGSTTNVNAKVIPL